MTIVDVCNYVYPGQQAKDNIQFGQDGNNPIFITYWDVPNVPEPSIEQLEALIPTYQNQFNFDYFVKEQSAMLPSYLDKVAQEKQYDSVLSCASYVDSTVQQWKEEATVFIAWRDAVFTYIIQQEQRMQDGQRSVPTFEEFKQELPLISWSS